LVWFATNRSEAELDKVNSLILVFNYLTMQVIILSGFS
jgi:hypothetical protein